MKNTALTKNKVGARKSEKTTAGLDSLAIGSISVMGGVSALIGIWAVSCFIGALITGGGPLEVAYGWFRAITGL